MSRITINCDEPDWQLRLQLSLSQRKEVDLINVDFETYGAYCETVAQSFSMQVLLSRDQNLRVLHFRKNSETAFKSRPSG